MRRHYVYYRVGEAELDMVILAVQAWQRSLGARHAGLQTELLRRPGTHDGEVTLMEVYGPLDDELGAAIEREAGALLPRRQRHVEAFDLIAP